MMKVGVAFGLSFMIPSALMACPVCDPRIELNRDQVVCMQTELGRYIEEAKLMDPVSINLESCDGRAPLVEIDDGRTSVVPAGEVPPYVPPHNCEESQSECAGDQDLVNWYFLSEAQLRCLAEPLSDPKFNSENKFVFDFETCQK